MAGAGRSLWRGSPLRHAAPPRSPPARLVRLATSPYERVTPLRSSVMSMTGWLDMGPPHMVLYEVHKLFIRHTNTVHRDNVKRTVLPAAIREGVGWKVPSAAS